MDGHQNERNTVSILSDSEGALVQLGRTRRTRNNVTGSWRGWAKRWLMGLVNRALTERLNRLEQQMLAYRQENVDLHQKLKIEREELDRVQAQLATLEYGVQMAMQPKDNKYSEVERQLTRIWQYYQDSKVQFEQINRQIVRQKATSEETAQAFRQKMGKMNDLHRAEVRDLKQQLDHVTFLLQSNRSSRE
jgi:DNA repair exonuclease SbcCD ATPase subunit